MATVTLGNIKFNWKGAYNSSTAYVVDDVVSLSGSSYVCIQAGTNQNPASASAYWEQMSSAGTDGTDVGTTLTTQGDILYRDGSGLQRLAKGTAGQALLMNTAANAPEWANNTAGLISTGFNNSTTSHAITGATPTEINGAAFNVAMTSAQKIHLFAKVHGYQNENDSTDGLGMYVTESGASEVNILSTATNSGGMGLTRTVYSRYWHSTAYDHGISALEGFFTWTAQTTGTHSFTIKVYGSSGTSLNTQGTTVWYMITSV